MALSAKYKHIQSPKKLAPDNGYTVSSKLLTYLYFNIL